MILEYNGIVLPYAATSRFDKTAVQDQSNTDLILMRYEIDVVVTLNYRYMEVILQNAVAAGQMSFKNAPACQVRIHDLLMARRKSLSVSFNGFEYIPTTGSNRSDVDSANGPIPQYCKITDVGNETCILQYGIVAHYYDITGVNATTLANLPGRSPVICNRWKETVDIDEVQSSVRTREGTFRIRSDPTNPTTPDQLRAEMAVISIPTGFLRKSSKYSVSEDGLSLNYMIQDQEFWKTPPTPAFFADGYYRETALGPGGVIKHAQCRTFLRGQNTGSQVQLLEKAISVCVSKLALVGSPLDARKINERAILISAVMQSNHYRNEVDVVITAQIPIGKNRYGGTPNLKVRLAGLTRDMTLVPFSDFIPNVPAVQQPGQIPAYRNYGSASVLLQAAAYYDPAAGNAALQAGTSFLGGFYGGPRGGDVTPTGDGRVINNGTQPGKG